MDKRPMHDLARTVDKMAAWAALAGSLAIIAFIALT